MTNLQITYTQIIIANIWLATSVVATDLTVKMLCLFIGLGWIGLAIMWIINQRRFNEVDGKLRHSLRMWDLKEKKSEA